MDPLYVVHALQKIAQAGLAYSENPFDLDRYAQLMRLAAEIASHTNGTDAGAFEALLRAEGGYPTPKVDVRAVIQMEGKLLFVREVTDGRWALPGGWADIGETPSAVMAREVLEETGYVVRPSKLLAVFDKSKRGHPRDLWWVYKLFFRCELEGGIPTPSHETVELGFFGEHELPPLSLPRTTEAEVLRMFEHLRNPDLPTDFD